MTEYPNPPNPGTTVNLGNEGLSEGEAIDSYLENYWNSGTHVQIPGGTYSLSSGSSLNISASSDAWLEGVDEGNGAQVTLTGGSQNCSITANGCNVRVENITMSGSVDSDRIRPSATTSGSTLTFIRFERPDGVSSDGDDAEGMFVPNTHAGELWLVDCWIEGFADNGLYASVPGNSDGREARPTSAVVSTGTTTLPTFDWAVPVIPVRGRFPSTTGVRPSTATAATFSGGLDPRARHRYPIRRCRYLLLVHGVVRLPAVRRRPSR